MSETTTEATATEATGTENGTTETAPKPTETVDFWKRMSRENEAKAKANAAAAKRLEEIEAANATEQEKAVKAARDEADKAARTEVSQRYQRRIVSAEVKAAAGGKLADPSDAVRLLDLDSFELDEHDNVDAKAVSAAIDTLIKQKPYLAAKPTKPTGDVGQGPREEADSASTAFGPARLRTARRDSK